MEIKLIENKKLKESKITIECREADEQILDIIQLSIVIYFITLKVKGKAYTEKLKEYQNKKNNDVTMY